MRIFTPGRWARNGQISSGASQALVIGLLTGSISRMRRVLLTLLGLFVAIVGGALWYASEKGFTNKWRNYVRDEFRKRGVQITLRQLTLDPVRGLVAKEVRVLDDRGRRTLAVIDEMALQVNYANLIRGKTFLDALDLRDASLSLPLDPQKPNKERLEIARLNARLFLPPQQIYLAHADAEIAGLRVTASGRLIHPQAFRPKFGSDGVVAPEFVARVLEELRAIEFEGEPPEVNVTFSGDLAQPDQIFVDFALWGERLRRKQYACRSLYVGANYRGGILEVKQLVLTDGRGEMHLSGLWEPQARTAQVLLHSNLNSPELARACGDFSWLDEFNFRNPPNLDLRLDGSFGKPRRLRVMGRVEAAKFAYRNVSFQRGAASFSWDGDRWSVREVELVHADGGELTGDVMQVPGEFRARLKSGLNPKLLRPLLSGQAAETLGQFEFQEPPRLTLEARGTAPTMEALVVNGETTLESVRIRGVPAKSARAKVEYKNRILSIAPFPVEGTEGSGDSGWHFEFHRDEERLN